MTTCGAIWLDHAAGDRGAWRFSIEGASAGEVLEQLAAVVERGGLSARRVRVECCDGDLFLVSGRLQAPPATTESIGGAVPA